MKLLEDVLKEFTIRNDRNKMAIKACLEVLYKYFSDKEDTIDIPKVLGDVLYAVEETLYEKRELHHLYYEWMSNRYMANFIPEAIESIKIIQKYLIERDYTEDNKGGHGCGDRYMWYIPHETKIIQCHTGQNYNAIIILDESDWTTELHIRRFWDSVDDAREDDWDIKESKDGYSLKKLLVSDHLNNRFSDNLPGNQFIDRPDLKMFKKAINNMGKESGRPLFYLDARDPGYILSYTQLHYSDDISCDPRVDCVIYSFGFLKAVLFGIKSQRDYFESEDYK